MCVYLPKLVEHHERHIEQLKAQNAGLESMLSLSLKERDAYIFALKLIAKGDAIENPAKYADAVLGTLGKTLDKQVAK